VVCGFLETLGIVVRSVPRPAAISAGVMIGDLLFFFSGHDRARMRNNFRIAFPSMESPARRRLARACLRHFGIGVIEVLLLPLLTRRRANRLVSLEGKHLLDAAFERGRGTILLTAHLGNWELLGAALAINGYPINVIARELAWERLDRILVRYRTSAGMTIIYRGSAVKESLRALHRNGMMGMLADVDTNVNGVFLNFLGRPALTATGPAALAEKTGATILPIFCIRQENNTYRTIVFPPLPLPSGGNREENFTTVMKAYNDLLESLIRAHPEQWIWMHPRWKTERPKAG